MCNKEDCLCRKCFYYYKSKTFHCGDCYMESLKQCREDGVETCRGYKPLSILQKVIKYIISKIEERGDI